MECFAGFLSWHYPWQKPNKVSYEIKKIEAQHFQRTHGHRITYLDTTDSICWFCSFQTSTPYFSISSRFSILQYELCFKTDKSLFGNKVIIIPSVHVYKTWRFRDLSLLLRILLVKLTVYRFNNPNKVQLDT